MKSALSKFHFLFLILTTSNLALGLDSKNIDCIDLSSANSLYIDNSQHHLMINYQSKDIYLPDSKISPLLNYFSSWLSNYSPSIDQGFLLNHQLSAVRAQENPQGNVWKENAILRH